MSSEPTQPMRPPSTLSTVPVGGDQDTKTQDDPGQDDAARAEPPPGRLGQGSAPEGGVSQATVPRAVLSQGDVPAPPGNAAPQGDAPQGDAAQDTPTPTDDRRAPQADTAAVETASRHRPAHGRHSARPTTRPDDAAGRRPQPTAAAGRRPRAEPPRRPAGARTTGPKGDWASEARGGNWASGQRPPTATGARATTPRATGARPTAPQGDWGQGNGPEGYGLQGYGPQGDWNRDGDPAGLRASAGTTDAGIGATPRRATDPRTTDPRTGRRPGRDAGGGRSAARSSRSSSSWCSRSCW